MSAQGTRENEPTQLPSDAELGSHGRRRWLNLLACLVLPLVWTWQTIAITSGRDPMWHNLADPSYVYLVGSTEVASGLASFANQHPGTPLFVLLAAATLAFHTVTGSDSTLFADVVARPETYLTLHWITVAAVQVVALAVFGYLFARVFGLGAALIGQSFVLGVRLMQDSGVTPVPLQIALALFLVASVGPALRRPRPEHSSHVRLAVIGILLALGFATKMTFWPALLLPVLLFRWRQLVVIYLWCVGFGTVFVLAIVRQHFIDSAVWWRNLLLSSGRNPGDTNSRSLIPALLDMPGVAARETPILLVAGLGIVLLILASLMLPRRDRGWSPWRGLGALALVIGASLIGTLRPFLTWDLILIPVCAAAALALTWSWLMTGHPSSRGWTILETAVPVVAVVTASVGALLSVPGQVDRSRTSIENLAVADFAAQEVAAGRSVATAYGVYTPATSLYFGQWLSNRALGPEISARYPGWLEYRLDSGRFYYFTDAGEVEFTCPELRDLASSDDGIIWIPGRDITFAENHPQYSRIDVEELATIGTKGVYRITNVECPT